MTHDTSTIRPAGLIRRHFLADMGKRPKGKTLDRINNDGNYEPGNCRWATWAEQRRNQARSLRAAEARVARHEAQRRAEAGRRK